MTTVEILEALRTHLGNVTDYRVGKLIGVPQQTVSQWRHGQVMSDNWAVKCADILKVPRAYLLACVNAERAKDQSDTSGVWRQIADAFRDKVALWLVVASLGLMGFGSAPVHAAGADASRPIIYIMRSWYCWAS
jgi:hypothetical protein